MVSEDILKSELIYKVRQFPTNFIYTNESLHELQFIYEGLCAGLSKNICVEVYRTGIEMDMLSKALNNSADSFKRFTKYVENYNHNIKKLLQKQFENWICELSLFNKMRGE